MGSAAAKKRVRETHQPVLAVTSYDRVTAWLMSVVMALGLLACSLTLVWYVNLRPTIRRVAPVEMLELPGGFEDGSPDETLKVESDAPESPNASPSEVASDEIEIAESLETVVEMSDTATEQVQQQFDTGVQNRGTVGSARGTGRRQAGTGAGAGGFPREQRWFVRFSDRAALDEYARQLDFFGIELGALLPDNRLAYLSNLTQKPPAVRYVQTGADEQRLYMTWQGGERRQADSELFQRANIHLRSDSPIFHFYPPETEAQLARLEKDYRQRSVKEIRRTYFAVEKAGNTYSFSVTKQILFDKRE